MCYNESMMKTCFVNSKTSAKKSAVRKICFALACMLFVPNAFAATTKYVSGDPVPVMEKPNTRSKKLSSFEYGTKVVVLEEKNNWTMVEFDGGKKGWVPSGNLTSKKLNPKSKGSSANARELALAGKGLSEELETAFTQDHDINYSEVDFIEKIIVTDDALNKFLKDGKLNEGEVE